MPRKVIGITTALLLLISLAVSFNTVQAVTTFPSGFTSETVVSNLTGPTTIAFAPDGRIFIGQKDGRVRVFQNGVLLATDFVNISSQVNSNLDRGLLGIAVHPDFPTTPYVYMLFTYDPPGTADNGSGARVSRMMRFTANPSNTNVAITGSGVVLLGTNSIYENIGYPPGNDGPPSCESGGVYVQDCIAADERSHTIGSLAFGTDGSLFVSSGDGASFNYTDVRALRALNIDSLNGKILRINPITGQGYADNPFYDGNLDSNRSKVYSLGLRNPFRTTVNTLTNELFIGDVGWGMWEEINSGRGANFGWPCYEGDNNGSAQQGSYKNLAATAPTCNALYAQGPTAVKAPVYSYNHSQGDASVQAGAFYRGTVYPALYQGALFFSDYSADWIRYLTIDGSGHGTKFDFGTDVAPVGGIVQLLVGPDTNLYYVAYNGPSPNTSAVRRIRYTAGGNTPPTANASANPTSGNVPLTVNFSSAGSYDPDSQPLTYSWNFGDGGNSTSPNPAHIYNTGGTFIATLTVTDSLGAPGNDTVSISVNNLEPVAEILSPSDGTTYSTDDTINYSGTGVDNEEGNLSGASLQWDVLLHHNSHTHFDYIPGLTGNTGSFVIPDHGDNSWIELCLTASDSTGLNDQECVDLVPNMATLSFNTVPDGLQLEYDGITFTAPFEVISSVNSVRDLIAPLTQGCHSFSSWSDGGAASHQILIGPDPQTYTAAYAPCTPTINWSNPADINFGTALSGTQLNATASVPGTFTYTPPAGTVLNVGAGQTLHVDFTPTDTITYGNASRDVTINVNPFVQYPLSNAPTLIEPGARQLISNATPSFDWSPVDGADHYEIMIASDSAYSVDVINDLNIPSPPYVPGAPLGEGRHFWRVRAHNLNGNPGRWSSARYFTVDSTPPLAPILESPADNATTPGGPTFEWTPGSASRSYDFEIDNNSDFTSPEFSINRRETKQTAHTLPAGTYSWHVRAYDAAGNVSAWSPTFTVNIQ